jgi:hypothetical protein
MMHQFPSFSWSAILRRVKAEAQPASLHRTFSSRVSIHGLPHSADILRNQQGQSGADSNAISTNLVLERTPSSFV